MLVNVDGKGAMRIVFVLKVCLLQAESVCVLQERIGDTARRN